MFKHKYIENFHKIFGKLNILQNFDLKEIKKNRFIDNCFKKSKIKKKLLEN